MGGLSDHLLAVLAKAGLSEHYQIRFTVEGFPACGTPPEALSFHRLAGESISNQILQLEL